MMLMFSHVLFCGSKDVEGRCVRSTEFFLSFPVLFCRSKLFFHRSKMFFHRSKLFFHRLFVF